MNIWAVLGLVVVLIAGLGGGGVWLHSNGVDVGKADCEQAHQTADREQQARLDKKAADELAAAQAAAALAAADRDKARSDFDDLMHKYQKLRAQRVIPAAPGQPQPLAADSTVCVLSDGVRDLWNRANAGGGEAPGDRPGAAAPVPKAAPGPGR